MADGDAAGRSERNAVVTFEELKRFTASVDERRGWDFSPVRDDRDPVPWEYADVVRRYLQPSSRVLDIGTGGGERFLALAPHFGAGVGIDADPNMVQVARENTPPSLANKVSFEVMRAEALQFPDAAFDVVLSRHAPVCVAEVVRVLCPGGIFITQQVGGRNTQNVFSVFGWGSNGVYWSKVWEEEGIPPQDVASLSGSFPQAGCVVIARAEYDVRYYFLGVESFIFWLKSVPLPEEFDVEKHWQQVARIVAEHSSPKGIETNEHRELLVVRKR